MAIGASRVSEERLVAQWLGQFSGMTHETRVQDLEAALRHAVAAFRTTTPLSEREKKAKDVRNLARRVLSARLRLLKSRIARGQEPRTTGKPSGWSDGIDALRARETKVRDEGVSGILAEFGAQDAQPSTPARADP
jgi:hypothetical protein